MAQTIERIDHDMFRFRLPADELAGARMRRYLEDLDYEFDRDTVDLLKLTATELVTNSVIHSGTAARGGEINVFVRVGAPSLLLKVCDRGPGVTEPVEQADPLSEGGRGLFLVDALSHSWGTSTVDIDDEPWACVWACFGADALPCRRVG